MMNLLRGLCATCTLGSVLLPAGPLAAQDLVLQGYAKSLRGETIDYHSAEEDVDVALLVRSLRRDWSIAWETQPVPKGVKGGFVTFFWLFGMDASHERHRFDLLIGGKTWFTFRNPSAANDPAWRIAGKDGAELRFRATRSDRYDDMFGYAALRLPRSAVVPGQPLQLEVRGESAGSRIWYMTFESGVRERALVTAMPALLRTQKGPKQPLRVDYVHLGASSTATLSIGGGPKQAFPLQFGWNSTFLELPAVNEARAETILLTIDGKQRRVQYRREPVRRWSIDLVQHTHTDIGYTRPQTEILPEHLRFIDDALDHCDATDDYPEAARFRWTCEASWPVREYLRLRPAAQIERLRRRVREGRIEITGMMFNISDLADENLLTAFLQPVGEIRRAGLPVVTAMQDDVNGAAWCLPDDFSSAGIRYLTMGQHGHRARIPFDKPTAFWWESTSGARVLAWRADHYNTGNNLGIHLENAQTFERELFTYLDSLATRKYPFDRVSIQHSGYMTDNSPPSLISCKRIRAWNEKYEWPRLRSSVARDFLGWVAKEHGDELPAYRMAWPDWWADGYGSAARETAAVRETQAEMTAAEGLLAMDVLLGTSPRPQFGRDREAVWDDLAFYVEHTFGAAESISEPESENSVVQWAEKSAYAWSAVKRSRLLVGGAIGLLRAHVDRSDVPTLLIVNTLGWARSGIFEAYIDHEILPPGRRFRIVDGQGKEAQAQLLRSREDGSYWAIRAEDIPAFGYCVYRIEVGEGLVGEKAAADPEPSRLENRYYRVEIDPATGAVKSLFDKELDRELVDSGSPLQLGRVVHEKLGNRHQLELLGLDDYSRSPVSLPRIEAGARGPIWRSTFVSGHAPGCRGDAGVQCEIRLFEHEKRIEIHYRIQKLPVTDPESLYVAFPFASEGASLFFEAQGGVAELGKDLLPGTAQDWQAIQSFASARSTQSQILVASNQIPLMQFGAINTGRFQQVAEIRRPHMYSWVMNNYWVTNFLASQQGELRWSYTLTSSPDSSDAFATRWGWSQKIPILARVLPAGGIGTATPRCSLLEIQGDVLLVGARPAADGKSIVLHLREIAGRDGEAVLRSPSSTSLDFFEVDLLGKRLGSFPKGIVPLTAHQVRFVRVAPGSVR